jgi:hypothetical protein
VLKELYGEQHFFVFFYVKEKDNKTYEWRVEVPDTIYWRAYHASTGQVMDIPKSRAEDPLDKDKN